MCHVLGHEHIHGHCSLPSRWSATFGAGTRFLPSVHRGQMGSALRHNRFIPNDARMGGVASIPAHGLVARHRQALLAAGSLTLTRSAFVRATSNDRRWLHVVDWILRTGWPTRTRDHALATRVFDAWWQAPMPHEPIPTWPHRKTWCKALRKAFGSVHNSEASKLLCVLFIAVFEAHIRSRWADDTSHWRMNRAPPA